MANPPSTTNSMVNAYIAVATYGALTSTVPTAGTAGTEIPNTGSPAYARLSISRGTTAAGLNTAMAGLAFNVPSGQNVLGYQEYSAVTAGTAYSGTGIPSFTPSSQAVYTVTPSMQVS